MKEPKKGQEHNFERKASILIIRKIGMTFPTSTMGYGSLNFSMYQTIGDKVRTQVGKTGQGVEYGHHRWKEEPIYWNS